MFRNGMLIVLVIAMLALAVVPTLANAGGDQNTNRGSEGEQIGESAPDPAQEPDQIRTGDPNPEDGEQ